MELEDATQAFLATVQGTYASRSPAQVRRRILRYALRKLTAST
jgi:hypothetical protein